jgi:acetyl-CoA carboxylase biotin carboxyl carrier protein
MPPMSASKSNSINADAVRKLAALLEETGLTEIEYASGEVKIRVARQPQPAAPAAAAPAFATPAAVPASAAAPAPAAGKVADTNHPGAVKSPMVGTVYLAPEPGAANFVGEGDSVREGQTMFLVEAMKTFNEIKSGRAGVVRRILVQNQQPVEYGETLAIVE